MQIQNALYESARTDNVDETPDSMFNYLIERVRNNLHIVLCMSPVGDPFRYLLFGNSKIHIEFVYIKQERTAASIPTRYYFVK